MFFHKFFILRFASLKIKISWSRCFTFRSTWNIWFFVSCMFFTFASFISIWKNMALSNEILINWVLIPKLLSIPLVSFSLIDLFSYHWTLSNKLKRLLFQYMYRRRLDFYFYVVFLHPGNIFVLFYVLLVINIIYNIWIKFFSLYVFFHLY